MSDQPLTDEQLAGWVEHSDPFPPYWEAEHDTYLDAMAAELLELRRTLNSVVLDEYTRPPLGYVVGFKTSHGWSFSRDYRGPRATRAGAEQEMANEILHDPEVGWKLLEVREVQP